MFKQGDAVVHPAHGVGIVTSVDERRFRGTTEQYYTIDLLDRLGTRVMMPTSSAETLGLRPGIKVSQLKRVWRELAAEPQRLPADAKQRNRLLDERLADGDTLALAAVVRDLSDRERHQGELTIVTRRHLRKSMSMLAGEIAAAEGVDLEDAKVQIRARLLTHPGDATIG